MTDRSTAKKPGFTEESVLRAISAPPVQVSTEDAQHDADTTTSADYDEWFFQALRERESETICPGYGGIQHPTIRLFEIGVDSIRAGRPSELFLTLLEEIGRMAEERDVMAELFPETFTRRIRTNTVRASQREGKIVEKFKEHVRRYLKAPKTPKVTGDDEKGGFWGRVANLLVSLGPEPLVTGIKRLAPPDYETLGARFERELSEGMGESHSIH